MKKIMFMVAFGILFFASTGIASAAWNTYPSDCPNPLTIGNYTTGVGIQNGSNGCWMNKSVSATAGQTINVAVYYDNTNNTDANNVVINLNQSPAGSMSTNSSNYSFSGSLDSSAGSLYLSQVTTSLSTPQTLTFSQAKWFQKGTSYGISLPNGQSGNEAFNGGLSMGTIANGDWGTVIFSFSVGTTVTPPTDCTISNFNSNPSTINKGDSSVLSWSTNNCNSVSISPSIGSVNVTGSQYVYPTQTTTYTLTAYGASGIPQSKTTTVSVNIPTDNCAISNFTANPTTIDRGSQSNLQWGTTGCSNVTIYPTIGTTSLSGAQSVYPLASTLYTLTATGFSGVPQTRTVTVNVNQPALNCVINNFTANPTSINIGNSSSLSWSTSNCTSVSISPSVGYVNNSGSQSVWPVVSTLYTLNASGPSGAPQSMSVTVNVNQPQECSISSFTANPTTIDRGSQSNLQWNTTNCTNVTIYPTIGATSTSGAQSVYPTVSTLYTLTASGSNGVSKTRTVTVNVNQPVLNCSIGSFTANPTTIDKGDSSLLSWETSNCNNVTIYPTLGSVNATGATSVYPLVSTMYTLTAYGSNGATLVKTVTVNVNQPTVNYCIIKTFTASSTSIKTNDSVTLSWDTENCTSVNISGVGNNLPTTGVKTVYPTGSTTYILTGNTLVGTKPTRSLDITVSDNPSFVCTIKTFTSNSNSIRITDSVTLSWDTENCTSVSISNVGNNLAASGTKTVYPTVSTTYVLTGNSNGSVKPTRTLDVTVTDNSLFNCAVSSFTANPTSIILGGFSTLNWATSNCTSVTISNLGYNVPVSSMAGGQSVYPAQTTTYTLTAYGTSGAAQTRSVTISVTDPTSYACVIKTFTANSTSIKANDSVTLSWDTDNCNSVNISNVGNNLAASGTKTVYPAVSTTYTLTGIGSSSIRPVRTLDITVTNNPSYNCAIKTFTANNTTVKEGDAVTISWDTENCTSVDISNVGNSLPTSGTKIVYPTTSTTYTLTGNSTSSNKPTKSIDITVVSNPTYVCSINSFTASNTSIRKGDSSVLNWATSNCTSVSISNLGYNVPTSSISGGQSVWPTQNTTYTLTAYGTSGVSQTKSVTIYVDNTPTNNNCVITNFSASDTSIQSGDSSILRWNTSDCDHVRLSGASGNLSSNGSKTVYPSYDTTYTLTAYGTDGNTDTDTIKIYVNDNYYNDNNNNNNNYNQSCSISSFTSDSTYINQNSPVTLRWYTNNCTNINVSNIGTVYASGSQIVFPNYTTTYILTASNIYGGMQTRSLIITVNGQYINPYIQPVIQPIIQPAPLYNSCAVTTVATNVIQNGAQLNGIITSPNGGNTYFEYGTSVNLGYRTSSRFANGNVNFFDQISGLAPNTIYYFRMNSDCQAGSSLGKMEVFRTPGVQNYNTNTNTNTSTTNRTVVVQGTTVVGTASPILLNITNKYELIGQGDLIDYVVDYKNIGGVRLTRPMVQVVLPTNVTLINASRGTYSVDDHTLSAPIEDLEPGQEGVIYLQARVDSVPMNSSQIVTTAILIYTSGNGSQENAMAYVLNTPKILGTVEGASTLAGNAFFAGLLSIGLLGWLLIILLILIIILIARSYDRNNRMLTESKTITHTTTQ